MAVLAEQVLGVSEEAKEFFYSTMVGDGMSIDGIKLDYDSPEHYEAFSKLIDDLSADNSAFVSLLEGNYEKTKAFLQTNPDETSALYLEMEENFRRTATWIVNTAPYNEVKFSDMVARKENPAHGFLTADEKNFYYEVFAENHMDINGVKLSTDDDNLRDAFAAYLDTVCEATPALGGLMREARARLKVTQNSMPEGALSDRAEEQLEQRWNAVHAAASELEEIAELDGVDLYSFAAKPAKLVLTEAQRIDAPAEVEIDLPEDFEDELAAALAEGLAASEMTEDEIAALEARAYNDDGIEIDDDGNTITYDGLVDDGDLTPSRAPLTALAAFGNAPALGPAIPSEAVPEGNPPKLGPAAAPFGNAPALGSALDGGDDITLKISDIETQAPAEDIPEAAPVAKTIWDTTDNEIAGIIASKEDYQDKFIKQALADWYAKYCGEKDLDDESLSIAHASLIAEHSRADILNDIHDDIVQKRNKITGLSEFDHNVINNHIAFTPDVIEHELASMKQEKGLSGTSTPRIKSWVVPIAGSFVGSIAVSTAASLTARAALDIATGGVGGMVAGAVGGGIGAFASERVKLAARAQKLVKENPQLTGHTNKRLMQEVIKEDKIATLQRRLEKVQKQFEDSQKLTGEHEHNLRAALDKSYGNSVDAKNDLNLMAKRVQQDAKRTEYLERRRNKLVMKLETTRSADIESFSVKKHLLSRALMGAVLGTAVGGVLSLDVVQQGLSNAFNAVTNMFTSGMTPAAELAASSMTPFDFATDAFSPIPDADLNTGLASLGLGPEGVQAPAAGGMSVPPVEAPLTPEDAIRDSFSAFFNGSDAAAAAPDPANVAVDGFTAPPPVAEQALAAAADTPIVTVPAETNALLEQFSSSDVQILSIDNARDAIEAHFGGDYPANLEPYLDNLTSENPAYRAEAIHSLAFLLNNGGDRELANAMMALNIMENGFDSTDPAVLRSIEGLAVYAPDLSDTMKAAVEAPNGTALGDLHALAERVASGTAELDVLPSNEELIEITRNAPKTRFTPI